MKSPSNSPGNQYWYNLNGIISRACIKNMETLSLSDFKIYSEDWSWQQTNRYRQHKTTYPDHSTQGQKCSIITMCLQKPMKDCALVTTIKIECWIHMQTNQMSCKRKNRSDLNQSYNKSPYTNGNVKGATWQHKHHQKDSKGRSVGVITVTQLVWFTGFTGPTFPLTAIVVY